ncbi:hypothetical protein AB1Y20_014274 [Prymnesium parvum]|uniref:Mind bomb SH3 repeat domain-containing protein n=1 Tax=Prymnesium parvum TaxID=97485 RepID=A0AB34IEQ3_PRYPA
MADAAATGSRADDGRVTHWSHKHQLFDTSRGPPFPSSMRPINSNGMGMHICDVCSSKTPQFRCAEGCDHDVCNLCVEWGDKLHVRGAQGSTRIESINGVYQMSSGNLWTKLNGTAIIYQKSSGSSWKVNDVPDQGGWYYVSDGPDLFSCTFEGAAGATGRLSISRGRKGFAVGERVRIRDVSRSTADSLQKGHGGIVDTMFSLLGCEGVVVSYDSDGDVKIKFDDGGSFTWNPELLEGGGSGAEGASAATKFVVGQRVRIRDVSRSTADSLQEGHGGIVDTMYSLLGCEGVVVFCDSDGDVKIQFDDGDSYMWNPELLEGGGSGEGASAATKFVVGQRVRIRDVSRSTADSLQKGHGGINNSMYSLLGCKGVVVSCDSDGDVSVQFDDGHSYLWNPKLVESGGSGEGASAASKFAVGQRVRVRDVSCDTAKSEQVGRGGWVYSMSTNLGCEGRVLHLISEFKVRVKVGDDSFIWSPTLLEPMETRGDPVTIRETSDHRGGQRGAIIKVDPDDSLPYLVQFDDGSTYWYKKSEVLLTDSSVAASPPQEAGQEASMALNSPGKWKFFISYTQRNAEAEVLASELYNGLKDLRDAVWLDVKMQQCDSDAMMEGVNNSESVIAIFSGGEDIGKRYLQREACVAELKQAIKAGKTIVPVVSVKDKEKVGEYINEGQAIGIDLSSCNFIEFIRSSPIFFKASMDSIRAAAVKQSKAKFCGEGSPAAVSHGSISARPGGMLAKVKAIKDSLGITATVPKDVVAEANAQIGLCSQGPLIQQVDALMEALGLE